MKKEDIFIAVGEVDERFLKESENYRGNRSVYKWTSAVAACLALVFIALAVVSAFLGDTPPYTTDYVPAFSESYVLNAAAFPENISGISESRLVFDASASQSSPSQAPSRYFKVDSFVVKAEFTEELTDTYMRFDSSAELKVIKLKTLEVIYGKNVPDEFYYIVFASSRKDLSSADTLIISMDQCGTEGYVLKNTQKNCAEALSLPVFYHSTVDNIIFFKDDICVANDSPYLTEEQKARMISYNGCTQEHTVTMIKNILADPDGMEEKDVYYYGVGKEPRVISCRDMESNAAKELLEYVKPFENGVFVQSFVNSGTSIRYIRYINGCPANEVITLNTNTEEVKYSGEKFTANDLENLENIAVHIEKLTETYPQTPPKPPHTDESGKKLCCVEMRAHYIKADGVVYGVLKTTWEYCKTGKKNVRYYDDRYILCTAGRSMIYQREEIYAEFGRISDMSLLVSAWEYEKEYVLPPEIQY